MCIFHKKYYYILKLCKYSNTMEKNKKIVTAGFELPTLCI